MTDQELQPKLREPRRNMHRIAIISVISLMLVLLPLGMITNRIIQNRGAIDRSAELEYKICEQSKVTTFSAIDSKETIKNLNLIFIELLKSRMTTVSPARRVFYIKAITALETENNQLSMGIVALRDVLDGVNDSRRGKPLDCNNGHD